MVLEIVVLSLKFTFYPSVVVQNLNDALCTFISDIVVTESDSAQSWHGFRIRTAVAERLLPVLSVPVQILVLMLVSRKGKVIYLASQVQC